MDFKNSLKQIQALLQKELAVFFREKRRKVEKIDPELVPIVDQIADLTLRGGKRFRPFLCWLGYTANSNVKAHNSKLRTPEKLVYCMLGLELFHTFALIHDDVIDQDEKRRGGDTIHEYFKVKGKRKNVKGKESRHFGMSVAILAGDLALSWADECINKLKGQSSNPPAGRAGVKTDLLKSYQKMKEQVIYGQTLDVMKQFEFAYIAQKKINELKTAWYSVTWPLTIGAILANAQQKEIRCLARYGLLVGQAYQLRDDFMDGDTEEEDFATRLKVYKSSVRKAIDAFLVEDQRKKLLSDIAAFVVARDS